MQNLAPPSGEFQDCRAAEYDWFLPVMLNRHLRRVVSVGIHTLRQNTFARLCVLSFAYEYKWLRNDGHVILLHTTTVTDALWATAQRVTMKSPHAAAAAAAAAFSPVLGRVLLFQMSKTIYIYLYMFCFFLHYRVKVVPPASLHCDPFPACTS